MESIATMDRELARFLMMRSSDAIDLIMGGMMEALQGRPESGPILRALAQVTSDIHLAVRAPIIKQYPELDQDQR